MLVNFLKGKFYVALWARIVQNGNLPSIYIPNLAYLKDIISTYKLPNKLE